MSTHGNEERVEAVANALKCLIRARQELRKACDGVPPDVAHELNRLTIAAASTGGRSLPTCRKRAGWIVGQSFRHYRELQ